MAQLHTSKGPTVKSINRPAVVAVSAVAALGLAAPAFATAKPTPTSLNLRAAHATVHAHSKDSFTATLTGAGKPVAGQTISLQERTAPTTGHTTTWKTVASPTCTPTGCITGTDGKVTFTVTPPIASHKNTQKDQYRAVYGGGTVGTTTYGKSHSPIVTVTVKRS